MGEPELWTTREAADHCGIKPERYRDYARTGGAPGPVSGLRSGDGQNLYRASAVRAWQAARPGRGAHVGLRGESNPTSQLTEADARAIREAVRNGAVQLVVAREYGISQAHVSRIVNRSRWSHVPDPSRSSTEGDPS